MKLQVQEKKEEHKESWRNIAAFWIFGFCKNFTFVVMLTAAQDILAKSGDNMTNKSLSNSTLITGADDDHCIADVSQRKCFEQSAGVLLICNILPSLVAKLLAPFTFGMISYAVGNWIVCILQAVSILMVALSDEMWINLSGVGIGAFSNGLGESYLLSMTALYHKDTVAGWASGTGLAGVVSSLFYSILTDRKMVALSPSWAIMITLFVPVLSIFTFHYLLIQKCAKTARKSKVAPHTSNASEKVEEISKLKTFFGLFKFIMIFIILYFAQYFVNQGLLEITIYDCAHSFGKGPYAQYRWYQVLYQWGVFLSRSSKKFVTLGLVMMLIFPWLQVCAKGKLSGYNFEFSGPSGNSLRRQHDVRVHPSLRDRLVPRSAGGNHWGHRLCQRLFLRPQNDPTRSPRIRHQHHLASPYFRNCRCCFCRLPSP
ncbi:hypothetical protein WR25_03612 [Diploscapter pachys]|uniref:Battenin n=1 Tax=Diploscapter pachys TaxID=2018661 RepID=A0A2A2KCP5_9BILA|nr:hypothetical protein WR25_03612 [Diploscapter pachys]